MANPYAASELLPPRSELKSRACPDEVRQERKASYDPPDPDCTGFASGKFGDVL